VGPRDRALPDRGLFAALEGFGQGHAGAGSNRMVRLHCHQLYQMEAGMLTTFRYV
jgi:hypothetical protein